MKLRILTAAGAVAALTALGGCGTDETTSDAESYSYSEEQTSPSYGEEQTPASGTSVPGTPDQDLAGTSEPSLGQPSDPYPADPAVQAGEQPVEMTEFAALDTDSNGTLRQEEWDAEAVNGAEFEQVDIDGNGSVDQEEFRQGVSPSETDTLGDETGDPMPESVQ